MGDGHAQAIASSRGVQISAATRVASAQPSLPLGSSSDMLSVVLAQLPARLRESSLALVVRGYSAASTRTVVLVTFYMYYYC